MSELSAVTGAAYAATQQAVSMKLLEKSLDMQTQAMTQLMAAMGLGQNIDVQA